jgi:glycosyltransferase involved in cell wall biosynthesis
MENPKVSVLMLAYNSSKYVETAIGSILNQSFTDFELVIVYDHSEDDTVDILEKFQEKDGRVRIIKNENEKGIVGAANTGLKHSKGEFVARMDSDDLSELTRLEKQVAIMEKDGDICLLGGGCYVIDEFGKRKDVIVFRESPEKIKAKLFFENDFVQSSVMIRKKTLDEIGYYSQETPSCEDYELWTRISEKYKVWNMPDILVSYRVHGESDTGRQRNIREKMLKTIYTRQMELFGISHSEDELDLHYRIYNNKFSVERSVISEIEDWFSKIYRHNESTGYYDKECFREVIAEKWYDICYFSSAKLGFWAYRKFAADSLSAYCKRLIIKRIKFIFKCMLKKNKGNKI